LKQFLEDIQSLLDRPLEHGNVTFVLQNKGIYVCDAPARASLKRIISHMGHSACERCTDVGMYDHTARHACLTEVGCQLRPDQSFLEKQDHRHHKGTSPSAEFGVQMISCFVLDSCHLACLGVMRRLMMFWKGKGWKRYVILAFIYCMSIVYVKFRKISY